MAELKEIKNRINSVKNTAQITKAMEMISASKMLKAQDKAIHSIPYAELIYQIVGQLGDIKEIKNPYLKVPSKINNIAIVVIGTSRGFVGGQITELTLHANKLANSLKTEYSSANIKGISIHKTGLRILQNAGIESDYHFAQYLENKNTTALSSIFQLLSEKFINSEYDLIYLEYTHFINTMSQKTLSKQLLPINIEELLEAAEKEKAKVIHKSTSPYIFEPDAENILNKLLPEYFQTQIFSGILESIASEHSARMVAMKTATDNANKLKQTLTLKYNRQRQSAITQQLMEVVNGRHKKVINSNQLLKNI